MYRILSVKSAVYSDVLKLALAAVDQRFSASPRGERVASQGALLTRELLAQPLRRGGSSVEVILMNLSPKPVCMRLY